MSESPESTSETTDDVAALIAALDTSDLDQRRATVDQLAALGEAALPSLLELFGSEDPKLRRWAATAVGKMGEVAASATSQLVDLVDDRHDKVSKAAVRAIRRVGKKAGSAARALIEKLDDRSKRHAAFLALVEVDPDADVPVALLIEGLAHRRFGVRNWASERLVGGPEEFTARLREAYEVDTRPPVKSAIGKALGRRGSPLPAGTGDPDASGDSEATT